MPRDKKVILILVSSGLCVRSDPLKRKKLTLSDIPATASIDLMMTQCNA